MNPFATPPSNNLPADEDIAERACPGPVNITAMDSALVPAADLPMEA